MGTEVEKSQEENKSLDYEKSELENSEVDDQNGELIQALINSNTQLERRVEELQEELNSIKCEHEETENKRQARVNRKRLLKRDPMTKEIYDELIRYSEGPGYLKVRLRLAFCILAVTGARISELLPLKMKQLKTLTKESWIAIDRVKKGPSNHKAFLTSEGKRIIKARRKDFEFMSLIKQPDSYIFTSELNHDKVLSREAFTRDVNKIMRAVSKQLPGKPNVTSHSFRIGYINDLWRDSKDIEFVRQTIGPRKLDITSTYIHKLSDQKQQDRIENFYN